MSAPDRLYGHPGDDVLDSDLSTAVDRIDGEAGEWVIEEWTVADPLHAPAALWSPDLVLEGIAENLLDGVDDDGQEFDRLTRDPVLLGIARALVYAVADRVTWRWADKVVATHTVVIDDEGVRVDGVLWWDADGRSVR